MLDEFFELLEAFGHEKELKRERELLWVFVELRQEGVVGKLLEDKACVIELREQVGEGGLAGADVSFYGNERVFHVFLPTESR